jgi:hypothetical protein
MDPRQYTLGHPSSGSIALLSRGNQKDSLLATCRDGVSFSSSHVSSKNVDEGGLGKKDHPSSDDGGLRRPSWAPHRTYSQAAAKNLPLVAYDLPMTQSCLPGSLHNQCNQAAVAEIETLAEDTTGTKGHSHLINHGGVAPQFPNPRTFPAVGQGGGAIDTGAVRPTEKMLVHDSRKKF